MLRDIFLAVALTVSGFLLYSYQRMLNTPVYVCDFKGLVKRYTESLIKRTDSAERRKELERFLKDLREIINRYGAVWRKGDVTGPKVKDITPEVVRELKSKGYQL